MRTLVARSILAFAALTLATPAFAQFNPGPNPITGTVTQQTLSTGTGTINAGGAISIASGGTVPLTMTGTSTLINNGTIQTLGSGRAIDSNSGVAILTITNNGLISSVSADGFRVNMDSTVSLTNSGTIRVTAGGQAIDWAAIATKSNTLTNQATGNITAVGEDAVRPGTNGVVNNAGTITATPVVTAGAPTGSDGIQTTGSGVTITNTGTISGRHGITGGAAGFLITLQNNTGGTVEGVNGSGINIDALGSSANVVNLVGATIKGGVLVAATNSDGDGVDVDGVLTLTNSGDILGRGAKGVGSDGLPNNAEAVAAGGGSITNTATGRIIGSPTGGDPTRLGNGILVDDSSGGNAVAATTVTNDGLIQGETGFGIKIIGTFGDTVTNRGTIIGGNGRAIDLGAGDDLLKIEGGLAHITGNVTGGAGDASTLNTFVIDPNAGCADPAGCSFSYGGTISSFGLVDIKSGLVSFGGVSDYTGTTRLASGSRLTLENMNLLSFGSSLDLSGGTLEIANVIGANGQTFANFALTGNSTIDLDSTSLTFNDLGDVGGDVGTTTLTVLDYLPSLSPDYAFRFLGNLSTDTDFLSLLGRTTINGRSAIFKFDGAFTDVLAEPVPEPSTVGLVALGGGLWLAWRRRALRNGPSAGPRKH